ALQHVRRPRDRAGLGEDPEPSLPHRATARGRSCPRPSGRRVIVAEHLTKRFGARTAVDRVSFTVERGEIVGFLGPNGAGKTTTIRLLAGVFPPSSGRAPIDGLDLASPPLAARAPLADAAQPAALDPH